MKCSTCPATQGPCPGEVAARVCELARTREDYRRLLSGAPRGAKPERPAPVPADRRTLDLVSVCPDRGPILSVSLQPACGCAELSECRAGRGATPGRVTLHDCLTCVETVTVGSQGLKSR